MEPKKPGRPLKFKSVEDLQQKIDAYFGDCDPHIATRKISIPKADGGKAYWGEQEYITDQIPYTITGLALALDTNRFTLLNYQDPDHFAEGISDELREQFIDTITRAKLRCEQFAEQHLFTGKTPAGAVFNLKNNYGWIDKTVVDQTNRSPEEELDDLDAQKGEVAAKAAEAMNDQPAGSPA